MPDAILNNSYFIEDEEYNNLEIVLASKRSNNLINEMFNSIPGSTLKEKLFSCNLCNCCETHKVNRPRKFEQWNELPESNTSIVEKQNRCSCNCRHAARFICRQAPQKIIKTENNDDYKITECIA